VDVLATLFITAADAAVAHTAANAVVAIRAEIGTIAAAVTVDAPIVNAILTHQPALSTHDRTIAAGATFVAPFKGAALTNFLASGTNFLTLAAVVAHTAEGICTFLANGIAVLADLDTIVAAAALPTPITGTILADLFATGTQSNALFTNTAAVTQLYTVFAKTTIFTQLGAVFTNTAAFADYGAILAVFLTIRAKGAALGAGVFTAGANRDTVPAGIAVFTLAGGIAFDAFFTNGASVFLGHAIFAHIATVTFPVHAEEALSALRTCAFVVANAGFTDLPAIIGAAIAGTFQALITHLALGCAFNAESAFLAFYGRT
jgi:hypothetical protein